MKQRTALVLRNYHCRTSENFALWLASRFDTDRYGHAVIDPNEGFPEAGEAWYAAYKELTANGMYVIALLSPALANAPDEDDESFKGIALLSELLHFWDRGTREGGDEAPNPALLIPVLLDCELDDLRRLSGKHEQLQDIAVPLLAASQPLHVSTAAFFANGTEMLAFADAIAARMKIAIDRLAK